jgi:predicted O-methyltransferase YrrM
MGEVQIPTARHIERSLLFSMDDDPGRATPQLIDIAVGAISAARTVDLSDISNRITSGPRYPDLWPGEHYKLLAGLVKFLRPRSVVEIGTATGTSALSLLKYLPAQARLTTFDVVEWKKYPQVVLQETDFADGRLVQSLDDLSHPAGFERNRALLESADLIFVDAAKDGSQESRFLENFDRCQFHKAPLIVFDDVRLWNMLAIWRSVRRPKLDMTSFGHWSGTGFIHWI